MPQKRLESAFWRGLTAPLVRAESRTVNKRVRVHLVRSTDTAHASLNFLVKGTVATSATVGCVRESEDKCAVRIPSRRNDVALYY